MTTEQLKVICNHETNEVKAEGLGPIQQTSDLYLGHYETT